jgi:thiamine biosynthesis lipoprotein ApbE
MVMGYKNGLELVEQLKGVECMIIVRGTDGTLTDYYSEGFEF